jgi:DNA-binding transcriptional regulator YiaG
MTDDASAIRRARTQNEQDDCQQSERQLNVLAVNFVRDHQDLSQFGFHVFFLSAKNMG